VETLAAFKDDIKRSRLEIVVAIQVFSKFLPRNDANTVVNCSGLRNFVKHCSQVSFTGVGFGGVTTPSCVQGC
jgi:hypothetical protein